jgi:prophage antirepressor-like protein
VLIINELKIFEHDEFGKVRVVEIEGKPYAVAIDVAKALGYSDPHVAIRNHCKGVVKLTTPTNGGLQELKVIPEGDIYRLIVKAADQSKNEEIRAKAEKFERWIFDEVLPTIRRTGGYVANEDLFVETYLPYVDEELKHLFKLQLQTIREQNEKIKMMQPKADYFDALVERNLLTNFRDTAKELHIKEKEFIRWLSDKGYIYRDKHGNLKPYAKYVPDLFQIKEWKNDKTAGVQTLITPKGKETFRLLLNQN